MGGVVNDVAVDDVHGTAIFEVEATPCAACAVCVDGYFVKAKFRFCAEDTAPPCRGLVIINDGVFDGQTLAGVLKIDSPTARG